MNQPVLGGVDLMDALFGTPFFPETITVYATSGSTSDTYGKPVVNRTARAGLSAVPAAVAAKQNGKDIQRSQQASKDITRTDLWWGIQTPGAHWEIVETDEVLWRGHYWLVNSVAVDPSETFTEMLCELVKPRAT